MELSEVGLEKRTSEKMLSGHPSSRSDTWSKGEEGEGGKQTLSLCKKVSTTECGHLRVVAPSSNGWPAVLSIDSSDTLPRRRPL